MPELGFRARRVQRRNRIVQIGAGLLALYIFGFFTGYIAKQATVVPIEGASPVSCITLAIIPSDVLPKPKTVKVNVLNGSSRVGMATITADILKARGFKIGTVGNFTDYTVTAAVEIHYGPAGSDAAKLVAAYIKDAQLVEDERGNATIDVIVGQNFDSVLTTEEAKEVLSRPIASPSGPGC